MRRINVRREDDGSRLVIRALGEVRKMNSVSLVEVIGPCWRLSTPIVSRDCAREGIGVIRMSSPN